jgi:hypothetical protein
LRYKINKNVPGPQQLNPKRSRWSKKESSISHRPKESSKGEKTNGDSTKMPAWINPSRLAPQRWKT